VKYILDKNNQFLCLFSDFAGRLSQLVALGLVIEKDKGLAQQVSAAGGSDDISMQVKL
jgi:hypothetical protein